VRSPTIFVDNNYRESQAHDAMKSTKRRRTALFKETDWADTVAVRAMRFGSALIMRMTVFCEEFGLTPLQYNVLRILYVRDEDGEGLPVGVIGDGLVVRGPDVTRLLDRLEKAGLIERIRLTGDRRVVRVRLTRAGFALVERVHGPLVAHHNALLAHLSRADLERMAGDLAKAMAGLT
jgi:DNA-binding MarR family transcriptional regulator